MIKPILFTASLLASSLAFSAQNYVVDPQLTDYRGNQGNSDVWISHEDSDGGLGDVGSSGDTAFDAQGSSRIRFKESVAINDFTAKPGLSQVIAGLPANTNMVYSLYYCDKKGPLSPSTLYYGVREVVEGASLAGKVIAEKRVHVKDLDAAPQGEKGACFRQVSVDFNSGATGAVEIFSLMEVYVGDAAKPDMTKDIEVRIDEFSVTAK
jgi:poly(beta-D-mannuronate) lyase